MKHCICMINVLLYILIYATTWAEIPENVRITDISATSFVVSWTTRQKEKGFINYGKTFQMKSVAKDKRGDISDYIHYIKINLLSPETQYFFEIVSGETTDQKSGKHYTVTTPKAIMLIVDLCKPAGKIIKPETSLSTDTIVYLTLFENGKYSETKSILVTSEMNDIWRLDLMNFKSSNHKEQFKYSCGNSMLLVEAESGEDGVSWMLTKAAHSKTISSFRPEMTLNTLPEPHISGCILVLKALVGMGYFPVLDINNNRLDAGDALYMLMGEVY